VEIVMLRRLQGTLEITALTTALFLASAFPALAPAPSGTSPTSRTLRTSSYSELTAEEIVDLARYIHFLRQQARFRELSRLIDTPAGNRAAGETYFNGAANCRSCHSTTGDLKGLATRIADPRTLQQSWLMPGSTVGRGGGPMPPRSRPPTAVITLPSGQKFEGELERVDDFFVAIRTADGARRAFRTTDGTRVDVKDPLVAHRELLPTFTDPEIHNVTAFLVTLK
jgi:hypothetical protein